MTFTAREREMLLVALDNLIVDYRKSMMRAKRKQMPATEKGCADAIKRYSNLAARFLQASQPRNGRGRG